MPLFFASPSHQQWWHWLDRIKKPLRKGFNYLCHLNVKKFQKVQIYFFMFLQNYSALEELSMLHPLLLCLVFTRCQAALHFLELPQAPLVSVILWDELYVTVDYHQTFNSLVPWEIWMKFYICNFQTDFSYCWLRHLFWNCPNMNVTRLHWWSVNIGSGNCLVPSGNKPLPEPKLTQISVAIWCH